MRKILIIDDDADILEALEVLLSDEGYDVSIMPIGDGVVEKVKNCLPDLVIMDVLLSGADGRNLCKELKSSKETQNIPVIMVSAHPLIASDIRRYGADAFLAKPFETIDLLDRVGHYLER